MDVFGMVNLLLEKLGCQQLDCGPTSRLHACVNIIIYFATAAGLGGTNCIVAIDKLDGKNTRTSATKKGFCILTDFKY